MTRAELADENMVLRTKLEEVHDMIGDVLEIDDDDFVDEDEDED
jgi:hypothetical protein